MARLHAGEGYAQRRARRRKSRYRARRKSRRSLLVVGVERMNRTVDLLVAGKRPLDSRKERRKATFDGAR